ncbi:MAG: hypothetical protein COT74_10710 [Bdellovibrionales bacterium CG10_big_fil_rev_8_21_14_0_10_45_34]|nr:MAG: hypothetical protein COT74_10710 [Bdellovibrionales bacterium CG10_big_fil_rev_8_21_14_0_10_45_34]
MDSFQTDFLNLSSKHLTIKSTVSTTPLFRNKAFLNQKYTVEGLTARQIAVLIGCGHSCINAALDRFDIKKKKQPSGWLTYGTKMENGKRVPHVRERMVIESILCKRKAGWSYQKISDWLSNRGIETPAGQTLWYHSTVRRIHDRVVDSNIC